MPGPLMIIGGAEDKLRRRRILKEFVAAAGGLDARIAVIPTASSLGPEIVDLYEALFRAEGAAEVTEVRPKSREESQDPELVQRIDEATGVFMTGGNQLKLSSVICGTPVGDAIVAAHQRGVVVAGTSAGASIQSSHMVAFGVGGATPKQRMTQVAAGLGLLGSTVIDQHFDQRNRYGRLLMIVSQSPSLLGLGIDEDTAAVVETDQDGHELLRVVGRGAVTVMDPASMVTNSYEAKRSAPHPGQRRRPARPAPGRPLRPHHPHAAPRRPGRRPAGGAGDRRGRPRPAPDGARHRRRRRLADLAATPPQTLRDARQAIRDDQHGGTT